MVSSTYCVLFLMILFTRSIQTTEVQDTCSPDVKECEIWLEVSEALTMMNGKDLVYSKSRKLIKYDEFPNNMTTNISPENVITADGIPRLVFVVNGSLPGPPIVAYEGQTLRVHVKNRLLSKVLVMHWHGLHQRDTPWMDGVDYVTQCPISPEQSFTYKFRAYPHGTFWYHSHISLERGSGVIGALIIKKRPQPNESIPKDYIMTVGDWHHKDSVEYYTSKNLTPFIRDKPYVRTFTHDGGKFTAYPFISSLIEGRGEYIDPVTGQSNGAPLTTYNVREGLVYRFRVINVGMVYPIRVSIDQHNLTVISSDGYDIKPVIVQSFIIHSGERFDFLIKADKNTDNYWIRADSIEIGVVNHTQKAILHYEGAAKTDPSDSYPISCTPESNCLILNCPFKYYPIGTMQKCINLEELESLVPSYLNTTDNVIEKFLNFGYPGHDYKPGSVNGVKFLYPGVPTLTQPDDLDVSKYGCADKNCGVDKICGCYNELRLPYNEVIQLVLISKGNGKGAFHPIHLHGHGFHVMKIGYSSYNLTTGRSEDENMEIDCGGNPSINYCNKAKFSNPSWKGNQIPGLNVINPIMKDTINIPIGGYVIIRIRSDNPGRWLMHCHIGIHNNDGMAIVLNEAFEWHPAPPNGFPVCGNFHDDHEKDIVYYREGYKGMPQLNDEYEDKYNETLIAVIVLAVIAVILSIAVVWLLVKRRSIREDKPTKK